MRLVPHHPALQALGITAVLMAAVVGAGALAGSRTAPPAVVEPPVAAAPGALVDREETVTDADWTMVEFHLDRDARVTLQIDVVEGRRISAFVLDGAEVPHFRDARHSIRNTAFAHHRALKADNVARHRASAELPAGVYAIAIAESSPPNHFMDADSARARIRVTVAR